jgi:hypothetical protein
MINQGRLKRSIAIVGSETDQAQVDVTTRVPGGTLTSDESTCHVRKSFQGSWETISFAAKQSPALVALVHYDSEAIRAGACA